MKNATQFSIIIKLSKHLHQNKIYLKDIWLDPQKFDHLFTLSEERGPFHFGPFSHIVAQQEISKIGGAGGEDETVAIKLTAAHVHH